MSNTQKSNIYGANFLPKMKENMFSKCPMIYYQTVQNITNKLMHLVSHIQNAPIKNNRTTMLHKGIQNL